MISGYDRIAETNHLPSDSTGIGKLFKNVRVGGIASGTLGAFPPITANPDLMSASTDWRVSPVLVLAMAVLIRTSQAAKPSGSSTRPGRHHGLSKLPRPWHQYFCAAAGPLPGPLHGALPPLTP